MFLQEVNIKNAHTLSCIYLVKQTTVIYNTNITNRFTYFFQMKGFFMKEQHKFKNVHIISANTPEELEKKTNDWLKSQSDIVSIGHPIYESTSAMWIIKIVYIVHPK